MKRLLPAVVVVCLLTAPLGFTSYAGETTGPGAAATPTPACTENCPNSSNQTQSASTESGDLSGLLLEALLSLLTIRG